MFGFGQAVEEVAARILGSVVENGRLEFRDSEGNYLKDEVEGEVEFEARERGYENSDEIGKAARDMVR